MKNEYDTHGSKPAHLLANDIPDIISVKIGCFNDGSDGVGGEVLQGFDAFER